MIYEGDTPTVCLTVGTATTTFADLTVSVNIPGQEVMGFVLLPNDLDQLIEVLYYLRGHDNPAFLHFDLKPWPNQGGILQELVSRIGLTLTSDWEPPTPKLKELLVDRFVPVIKPK